MPLRRHKNFCSASVRSGATQSELAPIGLSSPWSEKTSRAQKFVLCHYMDRLMDNTQMSACGCNWKLVYIPLRGRASQHQALHCLDCSFYRSTKSDIPTRALNGRCTPNMRDVMFATTAYHEIQLASVIYRPESMRLDCVVTHSRT